MNNILNFLVVDDHPLIVMATKLTIHELIPDASIESAFKFGESLSILRKQTVDVVILDIDIPEGENIKMIARIREIQPRIKIIIHSGYDEELYAIPYIQAGANAYISKRSSPDELKVALETVLSNKKYVSYRVQESLLHKTKELTLTENLSPAELQVMQMLIEGKWTKEIAYTLNLKQNTISTYKRRIFDKLGVRDSIELAKKVALLKN